MGADESELARYLEVISEVREIGDVPGALEDAGASVEDVVARSLIVAFRQEFRDRKGLGPQWLDSIDSSVFDADSVDWGVLEAAAQHQLASRYVRAKVGHLIWDHRPGRANLSYADAAIASFIELAADADVERSERISFAGEAGWLARRLNRAEPLEQARQVFLQLADGAGGSTGASEPRPDIFESAIDGFVALGGAKPVASDRLKHAIDLYAEQAHIRSELVERLLSLVPAPERGPVAEAEVDRLLQEAVREPAFRREHRAREALSLARRYGLTGAQGRAAAVINAIKPADYGFHAFELRMTIPASEVAKIQSFRATMSEREPRYSWAIWSIAVPTMQPLADRPAPIMGAMESLATLTLVSDQGHVTSSTTDAADRATMKHYEDDYDRHRGLYQYCIGPGLQILLKRPDAREALGAMIEESPIFSPTGKRRIERAFVAFENSEWDVVLDTIPTIEAGIRQLALKAGVSPYSASGEANQFKSLGGLISDVTDYLETPRLGRFWAFALTDALGHNLRNEYLHGIKESPSQFDATTVLHIFVQLLYIDTAEQENPG